MGRPELDNLVRVRQLKVEPATQAEIDGDVEIDEALLAALLRAAADVEAAVRRLGAVAEPSA